MGSRGAPLADAGSCSVDFAAPSSALDRCRSGPSRCSRRRTFAPGDPRPRGRRSLRSRGTGRTGPRDPISRDNRPSWSWSPLRSGSRPAGPSPTPSPEGDGTVGPPLVASSASPLRRSLPVRPLPASPPPKWGSPSGRGFHPPTSRSARVVSHHLGGFLRTGAAGLSHPAPGPGVRRVSAGPPHHRAGPRPGAPWRWIRLSRDAVTLRRVSSPGSRSASLRSLPSCRSPTVR